MVKKHKDEPVFDSLFADVKAFEVKAARSAKTRAFGKPIHPRLTEDKHPFDVRVGDFEPTHSQFLFLWALDRLGQSRAAREMDEETIGKEMESMIGGIRTYGVNTIHQMSDEMKERGLTKEEISRRPDGKDVMTYHLTPQGNLLICTIYEQNKLKGLDPYKGMKISHGILQ